jgi:ATP-dependent exoDNAse (exonuclease V) alpha subunit
MKEAGGRFLTLIPETWNLEPGTWNLEPDMAIYHFSSRIISRGSGGNAVGAAAYASGERIEDARSGKVYDFSDKADVVSSELLLPEGAPDWMADRAALWNAVEAREEHSTRPQAAQLAREIEAALPRELSREQRWALARDFAQEEFVARGMWVDLHMHEPVSQRDGQVQPHIHALLGLREVTPEGFGNKVRDWNDRALLTEWRAAWAEWTNAALAEAGMEARVDHRTLAAQGIERAPEPKIGPVAMAMERRGIETERGHAWREVMEQNQVAEIGSQKVEVVGPRPPELEQGAEAGL